MRIAATSYGNHEGHEEHEEHEEGNSFYSGLVDGVVIDRRSGSKHAPRPAPGENQFFFVSFVVFVVFVAT